MRTIILHNIMKGHWDEKTFSRQLGRLPDTLQRRILQYAHPKERQLRLTGKLMLVYLLECYGLKDGCLMEQLAYSSKNKPFFPNTPFGFSISHSGDMVVCGAVDYGEIGVDIAFQEPIDIELVKAFLSQEEYRLSLDSFTNFYSIWVKKEAVMKAAGQSIENVALHEIATDKKNVSFEGKNYETYQLNLNPAYAACVALTDGLPLPQIMEITALELAFL